MGLCVDFRLGFSNAYSQPQRIQIGICISQQVRCVDFRWGFLNSYSQPQRIQIGICISQQICCVDFGWGFFNSYSQPKRTQIGICISQQICCADFIWGCFNSYSQPKRIQIGICVGPSFLKSSRKVCLKTVEGLSRGLRRRFSRSREHSNAKSCSKIAEFGRPITTDLDSKFQMVPKSLELWNL